MGYDSIPTAASNAKESSKKKRVNRTAKLKQSKLDVRREQWLSHVKAKGSKEEINCGNGVKIPSPDLHERSDDSPAVKLEINPGGEENEDPMNHCSDSESPSNSPMSNVFGSNTSSSNFTSNSSSSCSESMTEEDDEDNECLDDWETIADALAADEIKNTSSHLHPNPEPDSVTVTMASQDDCSVRAWKADDVLRPQNLPNLLKQNSFPCFKNACSPSTCPICCEDLDLTDTSFRPCPCGYRLCLFCHKRILEDDGRCPGCRKQYDHHGPCNLSSKMDRSYSMI